jgi:hypothetical protein
MRVQAGENRSLDEQLLATTELHILISLQSGRKKLEEKVKEYFLSITARKGQLKRCHYHKSKWPELPNNFLLIIKGAQE